MSIKKLAKQLKGAVKWLRNYDEGCVTISLDNKLAICVGWSNGYDNNDESAIHSKSDPSYCINAGIKVATSDDMKTDYDYINFPYYANGTMHDTGITIAPNENYDDLAKYFLLEYDHLKKLNIDDSGLVISE